MGFWIFILIMCLLFPTIMILFGKMFLKTAPKEINYIFGYRTNMSMKNRDTWEFAHKFCGKIWYYVGLAMIPISVIPLLFVIGKGEDIIGTVGCIICMIGVAVIIASIFPTEIALRKNFDKDGNRIK